MSNGNGKVQILAEEGDTVVVCGSVRVRFNASGGIDVYGDVPVALHPAANDAMNDKYKASSNAADAVVGHVGKTHPLAILIRDKRDSMDHASPTPPTS